MTAPLDPVFRQFQTSMLEAFERYTNQPTYRGGFYSFFQINQLIKLSSRRGNLIKGRRIIDFGCGATRPVTASILLYLLGAEKSLALDLETPFDFPGIAVAEYCNILSIVSGKCPLDFEKAGVDLRYVQRRAADFDLSALFEGDLHRGLCSNVVHRIGLYQDLASADRQFDLMISNSVFEHVSDIKEFLKVTRESISDYGYVYSSIDFRDHRAYSAGASPWQYLMDDGDHAPNYINKIRFSEMMKIIRDSGFDIIECDSKRETPSLEQLSEVLPKYAGMSDVDLETCEAQVLLQPR